MDDKPKRNAMEPQENNGLSGLDPAELLKQGAGEDTFAENHPGGFTPPTLTELSEIFPRFEILELIGKGGMGAVYKVRQPELDRIVAMKILPPAIGLSPAFSSRFTREAKALAKLSHPGIVTIHESGHEGGLYYILMEYVDGVNLRQLLNNGRISPREAMAIVPQICDALQFAHDQGIVHRDIKPENLLLDRLGRVKVADFGIAKLIGNDDPAATATHTMEATLTDGGKAMGTPQYMAPEQIDSPMEVDHRADIFALGVVFYQMLTGELPEKDLKAPSRKVRIDVRLDEVVLRALEKNPELRYPSATDMRTGIEMIGDDAESGRGKISASTWSKGYRSKRTLFGLPLVHIAGLELKDGKQETAKGILAIGGKARGVLAFGGFATGVFAFGGVAFGLVSFGGVAIGAVSFGGLAIALLLALGGLAFGYAAMGGNAFGHFGYGAEVHATHALGANHGDPLAKEFFLPWATGLLANLGSILFFVMALVFLVSFGVPLWIMQRRAMEGEPEFYSPEANRKKPWFAQPFGEIVDGRFKYDWEKLTILFFVCFGAMLIPVFLMGVIKGEPIPNPGSKLAMAFGMSLLITVAEMLRARLFRHPTAAGRGRRVPVAMFLLILAGLVFWASTFFHEPKAIPKVVPVVAETDAVKTGNLLPPPKTSVMESRLQVRRVSTDDTNAIDMELRSENEQNEVRTEMLKISPDVIIWDKHLAEAVIIQANGSFELGITLDETGAERLRKATMPGEKQTRLAIIVDGELFSAPVVQSGPLGKNLVISGLEKGKAIDLLKSFPGSETQLKAVDALDWLSETDAGNYGKSYDIAAEFFRNALTREEWIRALEKFRTPLGAGVTRRTLLDLKEAKTMPGAPDGEYRLVQFNSDLPGKRNAIETVTLTKESDGIWRMSGYFIR